MILAPYLKVEVARETCLGKASAQANLAVEIHTKARSNIAMPTLRKLTLASTAALAATVAGMPSPSLGSEFICERGGAIRRVEIAVQDEAQQVPCEVVYWKDTERPGVRDVLWNAQTDAGFCVRKAEDLVNRLEGGGWNCRAGDGQPGEVVQRQAAARSTPTEATQPAPPAQVAAPLPVERPETPPPEPAPSPQEQAAPSEPTTPSEQARLTEEPGANGTDLTFPQPRDRANLEAVIDQNLRRLNESAAGEFAAEIAAYGDLDGDAVADAVIFFTYEAGTPEAMQFVAVYLFDGRSYKLVATRSIGDETDPTTDGPRVERIENGAILIQQGPRRTSLALRGGELVEVF